MMLSAVELQYLGIIVEGFLFGLYSGIIGMHLQLHHARNEGTNNIKQNLTHYALCVLYVLSMAVFFLDIAVILSGFIIASTVLRLGDCQIAVFACCDSIAQFILIYRCWIVWGRNIRVVIIPSVLAFAYLVMWIAQTGAIFSFAGGYGETPWGDILVLAALTASMTLNGLVTGLIVLKIFRVFRVRSMSTTSAERSLGVTGGGKLRSIMFVIIESAMVLFALQLTRLAMAAIGLRFNTPEDSIFFGVYIIIVSIHEMVNGITPTIILVRVSMGFSFHDEPSLEESIHSLRFAADVPNSMPRMGSIGSMDEPGSLNIGPDEAIPIPPGTEDIPEERRDEDLDIQIGRESDEIQMVDR